MKLADKASRWYFVDEAGDPAFYGKGKRVIAGTPGCSKTFSVGFLWTTDPQHLRDGLMEVRNDVQSERYLKDIPSVQESIVAFHAKNDCPEVRHLVYSALSKMNFRVNIVVARKQEPMFKGQFCGSQDRYYDYLVSKLFWNQLHLATENTIIFSRRGNKARQHSLRKAVRLAVNEFRSRHKDAVSTRINIESNSPTNEIALQAVGYAMWAVQRAFEMRQMRYLNF